MLADLPGYMPGQEYDAHEFFLYVMMKFNSDARYLHFRILAELLAIL